MKLLIATQNPGKLAEYRHLLADLDCEIVGTADVGLADLDVPEDGDTFAANAQIKAAAYATASGLHVIADDSGLCVDALDGGPGVYSARYGGPGLDDAGRRAHLLAALTDTPESARGAHFACTIAVARPDGTIYATVAGRVNGRILTAERGSGGFGYDALFLPDAQPDGHALTFGEMPTDQKNSISHRADAVRAARPALRALAQESS